MPVTQHPLNRSVHAELPHTALALGGDDQTLVRIRVVDVLVPGHGDLLTGHEGRDGRPTWIVRPCSARAIQLVQGITDVLGLAVVVEGVETREQLDTVIALIPERTRDVGIQGWYFAKAMSADDFIRFADESRHIVLS